jgi:hypothetical protein
MVNNSHVFVVDANTFPVHRDRLFCGVKNPFNKNTRYGVYADLLTVRLGDTIFFYQSRNREEKYNRGFRGVYRAISNPFFDERTVTGIGLSQDLKVAGSCPICGEPFSEIRAGVKPKDKPKCSSCGKKHDYYVLPNRLLIEPVIYYENPLDDNTAYINHTDLGTLWTMLFRKTTGAGRARSITPILPEEADKLKRLLERKNDEVRTKKHDFAPYTNTEAIQDNYIRLELLKGPRVRFESQLQAWLMANIDREIPVLTEALGPTKELEYFGNNVLYGIGGEKVDVLCLYRNAINRYKAVVIETKPGGIDKRGIQQINDYPYWVAQLATLNLKPRPDNFYVQPILMGNHTSKPKTAEISNIPSSKLKIEYTDGPCCVTVEQPILIEYNLIDGNIYFERLIN